MRSTTLCCFGLALSLATFSSTPVGATGRVKGVVKLEGPAFVPSPIDVKIDKKVCGAKGPILDQRLLAGSGGGVSNAVVYLVGDLPLPTNVPGIKLSASNCVFTPHVQSVGVGATLEMTNEDPILHNLHAFQLGRTLFNLALPGKGKVARRKLKDAGVVSLRTDSGHPWMRAYVVVVPNAFHVVTDPSGAYELTNVPPGNYEVVVWHERLGRREQQVTVKSGEEAAANFSLDLAPTPVRDTDRAREQQLQDLQTSLRGEIEKTRTAVDAVAGALTQERRARILADGRSLFLRHCATCHGSEGNGKGPSAGFLDIPPRDFLAGEYQFRMTPSGTPAREEDIFRTISYGLPGTPMPPWQHVLSVDQRRLLAQYLMALAPRFLREPPGTPIEIAPETPNDAESIARGKVLYQEMMCFQCHGTEGRGDGPSAGSMQDDWGNPIRAYDFTKPYYQGGMGGIVVYRAVTTGLSGLPMPSFAEMLEPPKRWDLVHYVQSLAKKKNAFDYVFSDPAGRIQVP